MSLQEKNIFSLATITEKAVLDFFLQDAKLRRGCSYKKNIVAVIKAQIPFFRDNLCVEILTYLPDLREKKKNIQYLTTKEIDQIKAVWSEGNSSLSLRDKAIGLLAFYTGMRRCDIVELTLANVDWIKDLISVRQQKTDTLLELPLRAVAGMLSMTTWRMKGQKPKRKRFL